MTIGALVRKEVVTIITTSKFKWKLVKKLSKHLSVEEKFMVIGFLLWQTGILE